LESSESNDVGNPEYADNISVSKARHSASALQKFCEYKTWCQRDLSTKRYVYWWADGIYFNVRLDEERSCVLVLIGALEDGTNEFFFGCR
jgi:transposase-like protein